MRASFGAGLCICLLFTLSAASAGEDGAFEPVDLPPELAERLEGLPDEKMEFLRGEGALNFAERHDILFARFRNKSAAEIEGYIDAMMRVRELLKFDPERDLASIPLNTEADDFNWFRTRRPPEFDTPREPGPINVSRYLNSGPKQGIPTFFNLPIALTPADLKAGDVEVAIMGAGLDTGSGFRGAAYGPRAVRTGVVYKGQGMVVSPHMHTMVSAFNELTIVDYGDIGIDGLSLERSVRHIREMVREVAETGTIPMIGGGDHALMYPDVAGIVDVYGAGNVGVIHFDAHYDAGRNYDHLLSHGPPVARLVEEGLVPGENFIQVGLRGMWPGKSGFEWMRENGFRYHTMAEVEEKGWEFVMQRAITEAREGPKYLYISFDVDVLDPAYMPGTGTPEPAGLTTREAFPLVRRLCAETNVVGFELVEVNPLVDPGYTTAQNATRILRECLNGIAMRKRGITEEHYLSPLTTDHGQE